MHAVTRATTGARPPIAREDRTFPWYIGGALGTAVLGGFALAIALPLAAALGWNWGVRWRALAQAHGHLQVIGWLGLFIAGMAFRLAPRFAGRPLRFPGVTPAVLILLAAGLLARAVAQPALALPGMRALLLAGAAAELAAAALAALALGSTLLPAALTLPAAPRLLLSGAGFSIQALLALWWLPGLQPDYPALAPDRDAALLAVQFYGFVLPAVLGVSLRSLPVFFRRPPVPVRRAWLIAGVLALGTVLHAFARLLSDGAGAVRGQQFGALLIAAATAIAIAHTGVWRLPERLRPSARAAAVLIQTAYAWLAAAMLWLAADAAFALRSGLPVPPAHADAIRHLLALGVFTTLVFGMGQLVLPWFAMRRQRPATTRGETWTLWLLITGATGLRVGGALLEETRSVGAVPYWLMAAGGVLALTAVAFFALTLLHAARTRLPAIPVQVKDA